MYRVSLQQFEGPMDLLLFFIKRDEIDVHDIPIAQIADEYLAYVRVLEEIDLDGVGDFIYMAALLINLKARVLLPSEDDEAEGEEVDPRRELVERLLEYVRFKEAAERLETRRERRRGRYTRGEAASEREEIEDKHEVEVDASVYDLMDALANVLDTADEGNDEPTHNVEPLEHTVEDQQRYILERVASEERVRFRRLVARQSKGFVIATFLAVLELARQRYLHIALVDGASDFALAPHDAQPLHPDDPALVGVTAPGGNGGSEAAGRNGTAPDTAPGESAPGGNASADGASEGDASGD
jgi:segregation and condensation protein A